MAILETPIQYFPDPTKGRPVFNGSIYGGVVDLDPKILGNQVQLNVVEADGTVVPVSQPVLTNAGGTPTYNGLPVRLSVDVAYALRVDNAQGSQVYYVNSIDPTTDLSLILSSSQVNYQAGNNFTGGVDRTQENKNTELISVKDFGAVGDWNGTLGTDDTAAIQAAVDYVIARSVSEAYSLSGAGTNNYPAVELHWPDGKAYLITLDIAINHPSISMVSGGRTVIATSDRTGYLFNVSGTAFRHSWKGFTFESTQDGIANYDCDNVSASLVWFDDCRFVTDAYGAESGIGVRYRNRSSELLLTRSYFNRIKHPVHNRECDFVTFDNNCWFGFATNAIYADKDSYIRNDSGFMKVNNSLFAGGPAADAGVTNGTEIAYFNIGTEAVSPDVTIPHGRLSISNTRIGYETGAGALVNYFTPYQDESAGEQFHSGIQLHNIQTNPREEKQLALDGVVTAPLVRLFTMPNQLILDGVHGNGGRLGVVSSGSTTDLQTLRESVLQPIDYASDLADQKDIKSILQFRLDGVTSANLFPVVADIAPSFNESNQWAELFGKFNYFFDSDFPIAGSSGNSPTINVDTFFNVFASQLGSIFEVYGGCFTSTAASGNTGLISGTVSIHNDKGGDAITIYYDSNIDYSAQPEGIEITPFFLVGGVTEKATITQAEAADANIRIRVQHLISPGAVNVRCRGLMVRPVEALSPSKQNSGLVQG